MIDRNRNTPDPEKLQPDPQLRLSRGRANWLQMTLVAAACAFILGIMIYGLNRSEREGGIVASSPSGTETTGAAPQPGQAQSGGNVAGGQNAAKPSSDAPQQNEPSQQPTPEQAKPTTPDDSKR